MGLGALQPAHLIVILVIVLLIFGPGKLPELGRAMGDGLRELKKATGNEDARDATTLAATTSVPTVVAPIAPVAPISVAPGVVAPPPTLVARVCPSCRGTVPVGDKFCGNCGVAMEQVTRSA